MFDVQSESLLNQKEYCIQMVRNTIKFFSGEFETHINKVFNVFSFGIIEAQ